MHKMAPRALLTDGEREAIRGETDDMTKGTRDSHFSRLRSKIEQMEQDVRDLREHQPEYYESLREVVCEPGTDERLTVLENEVPTIQNRLDDLETAVRELQEEQDLEHEMERLQARLSDLKNSDDTPQSE